MVVNEHKSYWSPRPVFRFVCVACGNRQDEGRTVKDVEPKTEAIACSILFDTPHLELFPELHGRVYEFVLRQAEEPSVRKFPRAANEGYNPQLLA